MYNNFDFCAVVIWYNPDLQCVNNIKSYIDFVSHVYVVDNSRIENSSLLQAFGEKITYIPNYDNLGIAKAQNTGCQKAFEKGYEWCMTMDQDSRWDKEQLCAFIDKIVSFSASNYVSFGVDVSQNEILSYTEDFIKFIKQKILKIRPPKAPEQQPMDVLIASGNVFKLKCWKEIGGYREDFFIDEVDHEFALKMKAKYGDCAIQFNQIHLDHHLGNPKKTLFPRCDSHSGIRLYYCVRNMMYLTSQYPEYNKKWHRRRLYIRVFLQNLRDFRFKDLHYMIKGYKAYKKETKGVYKGK